MFRWQNVVETMYMLHILPTTLPSNADDFLIEQLRNPPPNWSLEADEELVRFLVDHCKITDQQMSGASKFVESINVSTVSCLFYKNICYNLKLSLSYLDCPFLLS